MKKMAFVYFLSNSKDMGEAYLRRFDVILELESMPKEKKNQNIKKLFNKKYKNR
ncbi:hypothetical protein LDH76_000067 [Campylobacter lari]|nr:hypothetical protein [Campylobacter lari]EFO9431378.1 hypothetical protein [Campylobacter lari]EGK0994357.1 hypothetical protein [Campylobacter lari]EIE3556974.1 hypothetical protein [Campylobacter lari]EIE4616684.1 hypothetical protein [Campylobacter lari]